MTSVFKNNGGLVRSCNQVDLNMGEKEENTSEETEAASSQKIENASQRLS